MRFYELFGKKPVIGMIHLAGNKNEKIKRGIEELIIYQEEGIAGAIVEDYHAEFSDVYHFLQQTSKMGFKIITGINILGNPYSAFKLAEKLGARFVQFDSVQTRDLDLSLYDKLREKYPDIVVLGGVGFKYIAPTGNPLELDLQEAKERCEAIVTTGAGTGIETPIEKLIKYKKLLGDYPLVVGAGTNPENIHEQLMICDGAIAGSCFKPYGDTTLPVEREKVKVYMLEARKAIT